MYAQRTRGRRGRTGLKPCSWLGLWARLDLLCRLREWPRSSHSHKDNDSRTTNTDLINN